MLVWIARLSRGGQSLLGSIVSLATEFVIAYVAALIVSAQEKAGHDLDWHFKMITSSPPALVVFGCTILAWVAYAAWPRRAASTAPTVPNQSAVADRSSAAIVGDQNTVHQTNIYHGT